MEENFFMDEDSLSSWSGSITPPFKFEGEEELLDNETELLYSQCVVPLDSKTSTPPTRHSRNINVEDAKDELFCFNCHGLNLDGVTERCLAFGDLQRLLKKQQPYPNYFKRKSLTLFGISVPLKEGLLPPFRRELFLLLRQHINNMTDVTQGKNSSLQECAIPRIKEYKNLTSSTIQEIKSLMTSLDGTMFNITPITRPVLSLKDLDVNDTKSYLAHLVLDLNWRFILILAQLCLQDEVDDFTSNEYVSLLEERCTFMMQYLIKLIGETGGNTARWDEEASYFPCPCCKLMWILLIQLLDQLSTKTTCQAFWSLYSSVASYLSNQDGEPSCNCEDETSMFKTDPISHGWWLLWGIASLYWYDAAGKRQAKSGMYLPSNWLHVQELLRATFKSKDCPVEEKLARHSIKCCLKLTKIWDSSSDVITFLWDFFHKRLNDKFTLQVHGIFNMTIPCQSAIQWMEAYSTLSKDEIVERLISRSGLLLFFHVALGSRTEKTQTKFTVERLGTDERKILLKFHKKRMEDLSDIGVKNFISLFLVLAVCIETEDIAGKMCSFLGLIHRSRRSLSILTHITKGMFAMLHVRKKTNMEAGHLTDRLKSEFQELCRSFSSKDKDLTSRRNSWQLINLYLDSTEEVYNSSQALECEADLLRIGESLSAVLACCSESEAGRVFSLLALCFHHQGKLNTNMFQASSSAFFEVSTKAVWSGFYPGISKFLTDKHHLQQTPQQLANVAASFSLLAAESSSVHLKAADFKDMLMKYCATEFPARFVSNLTEVHSLVGKQTLETVQQCQQMLFSFTMSLGNRASSSHNLEEIKQFRSKAKAYFGNVVKFAESFLQTGTPIESLRLTYSFTGKLVKHCSRIIYSKTSPDCLLPKILDQMILPLQGSKKFLAGLSSLDFKRDEFVRRKIKEIFSRYFLNTTKRCLISPTSKNPFLIALQNTFLPEPTEIASDFRQFVVDIVADSFLVLPQAPDNHSAGLYFILQLLQMTKSVVEIIRNSPSVIIQTMCSIISCDACSGTSSEPPGIRKPATQIITLILKANLNANVEERWDDVIAIAFLVKKMRVHMEATSRKTKIQHQLQNVLMLNVPQFQGIVFKSFELVAELDKNLALSIVQTAHDSVEESERGRGCGEDKYLRAGLNGFLNKLE
eukprot:gene336-968_t